MNPTLISGFEDVITHIKQLEQRVMGLEEENKNLEERCESTALERDGALDDIDKLKEENDIDKLKEENEKLKESIEFIRKTCLMADEENKKLKEELEVVPDGVMRAFRGLCSNWWSDEKDYYCENFDIKEKYEDDPANIPTKYLSDCNYTDLRILADWLEKGKYDKYELEESEEDQESSDEEEEVNLDWICYEFVRYDFDPEDGSVYDTDGTKIADWDDQGEGKMIWVDKKYEDKHKELAKKSMDNLVAMATAPLN